MLTTPLLLKDPSTATVSNGTAAAPAAIAATPQTQAWKRTAISVYSLLSALILYGSANLGLEIDIGLLVVFLITGVLANTIFFKDKLEEEFLTGTSAATLPAAPLPRPRRTCGNITCCVLIYGLKLLFSCLGNLSLYWAAVSSIQAKFNNTDLTIAIAALAIAGYLNESIISVSGSDTLISTGRSYGQLGLAQLSQWATRKYKEKGAPVPRWLANHEPPYKFLYTRYAALIALVRNPEEVVLDAEFRSLKVKDILAVAKMAADLGDYKKAYELLNPIMPNLTKSNLICLAGLGVGAASGIAFSLNGAELILQALYEVIKAVLKIQVDLSGDGYQVLANFANLFALGFGITYGWEGGEMIFSLPERILNHRTYRDFFACLIALAIPAFSCGAAVVQARLSGNGMVMVVLGGLSPVLTNMTPTTLRMGYGIVDFVIAKAGRVRQCAGSLCNTTPFQSLDADAERGGSVPFGRVPG